MRRIVIAASGTFAVGAILALGIAVAGLAASGSLGVLGQTTSEETTETTEKPTTTKFRAVATAGAEVPKPKGVPARARGTLAVTTTESSGSVSIAWTLIFKSLTGRAQAAHIHRGKPGKVGPVVVSLCGPCRSGQKGKAAISKSVATAIKSGATYVNVHTAKNRTGEIRGQLKKR